MKHIKKLLAFAVVAVLMLSLCSFGAYAANQDSGKGGSASITITLPTEQTAPTGETTYKIYKVFDATSDGETTAIAYQLVSGKTAPVTATDNLSKFDVDAAGNVHFYSRASADAEWAVDTTSTTLSAAMVDAIAAYVGNSDLVYTATVAAGETSVTVTGLEYGYYYIASSTGSVVSVDSTNPSASVNDKNIIPVVKKAAGTAYSDAAKAAIAQVGTSQSFTAQIVVGKVGEDITFTDTMTNMTYNGDAKVFVNGQEVQASADTFSITGAAGAAGFSIVIYDKYLKTLNSGDLISIQYSGKITSDALSTNPAENTATISWGEGNTQTTEPVKVYNAKFTVTKQDGNEKPLPGAGFVLKNADGAYYKLNPATEAVEDDPATEDVDETAAATQASITWYQLAEGEKLEDAIKNGKVTEYTSDATGAVTAFTGLGNGTYTLVESTTPSGYNTAADYEFTISGTDFTTANLEQATTVVNHGGTELPSTGGIGTTIFYVVGAILLIGAAVVLFTKKRVNRNF